MLNKTLITLTAVVALGVSSAAIARSGGGGGGGGHGGSGVAHFRGRFDNHFLRNHFLRNQAVLGGWGWGSGYGDNGYGNTTVVAFRQATPQAANVTGSIATTPCHWNEDTFSVPSCSGRNPASPGRELSVNFYSAGIFAERKKRAAKMRRPLEVVQLAATILRNRAATTTIKPINCKIEKQYPLI